jgi:hypothetical protein
MSKDVRNQVSPSIRAPRPTAMKLLGVQKLSLLWADPTAGGEATFLVSGSHRSLACKGLEKRQL